MARYSCDDEVDVVLVLGTAVGDALNVVLPASCTDDQGGAWWNELTEPPFRPRYTYAPPSAFLPGQVLLSVTTDMTTLVGRLVVSAPDAATLLERKAEIASSLARWRYRVEIRRGALTIGSWSAGPTIPLWDDALSPHLVASHTSAAAVAIPVQPAGGL